MPPKRSPAALSDDADDHVEKRARTDRPQRSNAGQRALPAGYVDLDQLSDEYVDASDSDDNSELEDLLMKKGNRGLKGKKLPEPRPLSEEPANIVPDTELDETDTTLVETGDGSLITTSPTVSKTLSLIFNVPQGHIGPFVVNLDLGALITGHTKAAPNQEANSTPVKPISKTTEHKVGFLDLPAELRNTIYSLALVKKGEKICFPVKQRTPRIPNILATCRQVNFEASQLLYGEHEFQLTRCDKKRGKFYEPESDWKTIGYKDVRVFLQTIGPINVGNIKKLTIIFEDGTSDKNDREDTHRFTNDTHLIAALRQLAAYGRVRFLRLSFHPRRKIHDNNICDINFLTNLYKVKGDKVCVIKHPDWPSRTYRRNYWSPRSSAGNVANVDPSVVNKMLEKMERKDKLYERPPSEEDDDDST